METEERMFIWNILDSFIPVSNENDLLFAWMTYASIASLRSVN